jgi:hypothetical protein
MPVETLTYAALGVRLTISPKAARSLAKRLRLPRSLSNDGKALVSVDLAEIRHTPRPSGHRADFERERERADRLMVELLQATAETMAAREATARLEGFLRTDGRTGGSIDNHGLAARRLGHQAADIVAADRKAFR